MRALTIVFVGGVALAATSAQAAPLAPRPQSQAPIDVAPPIKLVAEGCGWGWHRHHWIDRWGHWHWGHCVPNHW
jgi:cyanophycinase-like exopeptidase